MTMRIVKHKKVAFWNENQFLIHAVMRTKDKFGSLRKREIAHKKVKYPQKTIEFYYYLC